MVLAGIFFGRVLLQILLAGLYELPPFLAQNAGDSKPLEGLVACLIAPLGRLIPCLNVRDIRLDINLFFSARARSSGVICCQSWSRRCCAQSLLGLAANAELAQR